jgi:flagellar basal-body rod protein FlgB
MEITGLLEKALNVRAFYHKVLAGNIANIETPGYKEKDIDFRAELDKSLDSTTSGTSNVHVIEKADMSASMDGNSVVMEDQIMKLTENTMMFNSFVQLINKKFSMMRYVINGGR